MVKGEGEGEEVEGGVISIEKEGRRKRKKGREKEGRGKRGGRKEGKRKRGRMKQGGRKRGRENLTRRERKRFNVSLFSEEATTPRITPNGSTLGSGSRIGGAPSSGGSRIGGVASGGSSSARGSPNGSQLSVAVPKSAMKNSTGSEEEEMSEWEREA